MMPSKPPPSHSVITRADRLLNVAPPMRTVSSIVTAALEPGPLSKDSIVSPSALAARLLMPKKLAPVSSVNRNGLPFTWTSA
jgi:hypothetical protein